MRRTNAAFLVCVPVIVCLMASCKPGVDQTLEETIDERYPIAPTATLSVTNRDGSIRIYGAGDGTREVQIEAIKKAYSAERLKAISMKVSAQPDTISIETIYPSDAGAGFSDRSGTVDYVIVIPQTVRISKLELSSGEVQLEGMRSDEAHIQLSNGRIFAHNCFGNLDLNLKTGNLAITYEWWEEVQFSIRSTVQDGNAFAYIPSDAAFHLIAHTTTGQIGNDFEEKENRHADLVNKIDMMVGGNSKTTFQFETENGNIKIIEHNP
jgi:DUF4097 and DUF4098 domain-containing protein YvlB